MQKVFVMYKLKPGVSMEEYKAWSRRVDQVITPHQPGAKQFQVFEIKGADKGTSPYQVVESIDVAGWDAWQTCLIGPGMKDVVKEWDNYGDSSTLVTLYGDEI
jgi:hypothetical protein